MSKHVFSISGQHDLRQVMLEVWHCVTGLIDGSGVKVTVQTASQRTLMQNRRMWATLTDISEQVVWYGRMLTPENWKDVLTASLRKLDVVPNTEGTGFVVLGGRTSEMSIREMAELCEFAEAFGVTQGVKFKAPAWMMEEA